MLGVLMKIAEPLIARPIPMKRELKGPVCQLMKGRRIVIARLILMKRELRAETNISEFPISSNQ